MGCAHFFDVVFLRPVVGSALMRWLRSASLLRSILRLVFSYVAGASTSGSCAPPPTKKAKQAAEAAAVYEHLSTHAQHVPPLRVGRPPEELTAGSHSYRATGGKCPKCGWQANNFPKSSGAHAHTQTRTHARTHARTRTHAHTHIRTCARARRRATRTHAHIHARRCILLPLWVTWKIRQRQTRVALS